MTIAKDMNPDAEYMVEDANSVGSFNSQFMDVNILDASPSFTDSDSEGDCDDNPNEHGDDDDENDDSDENKSIHHDGSHNQNDHDIKKNAYSEDVKTIHSNSDNSSEKEHNMHMHGWYLGMGIIIGCLASGLSLRICSMYANANTNSISSPIILNLITTIITTTSSVWIMQTCFMTVILSSFMVMIIMFTFIRWKRTPAEFPSSLDGHNNNLVESISYNRMLIEQYRLHFSKALGSIHATPPTAIKIPAFFSSSSNSNMNQHKHTPSTEHQQQRQRQQQQQQQHCIQMYHSLTKLMEHMAIYVHTIDIAISSLRVATSLRLNLGSASQCVGRVEDATLGRVMRHLRQTSFLSSSFSKNTENIDPMYRIGQQLGLQRSRKVLYHSMRTQIMHWIFMNRANKNNFRNEQEREQEQEWWPESPPIVISVSMLQTLRWRITRYITQSIIDFWNHAPNGNGIYWMDKSLDLQTFLSESILLLQEGIQYLQGAFPFCELSFHFHQPNLNDNEINMGTSTSTNNDDKHNNKNTHPDDIQTETETSALPTIVISKSNMKKETYHKPNSNPTSQMNDNDDIHKDKDISSISSHLRDISKIKSFLDAAAVSLWAFELELIQSTHTQPQPSIPRDKKDDDENDNDVVIEDDMIWWGHLKQSIKNLPSRMEQFESKYLEWKSPPNVNASDTYNEDSLENQNSLEQHPPHDREAMMEFEHAGIPKKEMISPPKSLSSYPNQKTLIFSGTGNVPSKPSWKERPGNGTNHHHAEDPFLDLDLLSMGETSNLMEELAKRLKTMDLAEEHNALSLLPEEQDDIYTHTNPSRKKLTSSSLPFKPVPASTFWLGASGSLLSELKHAIIDTTTEVNSIISERDVTEEGHLKDTPT